MHDKAFNIANYLKYDGYQRDLTSMVYKFFDKKTSVGVALLGNKSVVKKSKYVKQRITWRITQTNF